MTIAGLIAALAFTGVDFGLPSDSSAAFSAGTSDQGPIPGIEIWSTQEIFRGGDPLRLWVRTTEDAYIAVLHIDPDGMVHILFPHFPWETNSVRANQQTEIVDPASGPTAHALRASDYPGMGYLFALASAQPLDFTSFAQGDYWSYQSIGDHGRVTTDPYVAFMTVLERMAAGQPGYYDVFPYHVGSEHKYPRFLCYDCHGYAPYTSWNPYERECGRYRMVVFDAPRYYPARVYSANRVVYAGTGGIDARFVFTDREEGDPSITTAQGYASEAVARRMLNPVNAMDRRGSRTVPVQVPQGSVWKSLINWISVDRGRDSVTAVPAPDSTPQLEPQGPIERLRPRLQRRIPNSRTGVRVRRPTAVRPPQQSTRKPPTS